MTSPSATRLPSLSENFPTSFSEEFKYTDSNLKELIEEVASFTSKIYATFPALGIEGRNELTKVGISFNPFHEAASTVECKQFEEALKNEIITVFNQKEENISIKLSTHYSVDEPLAMIAKSAFKNTDQLGILFPSKTCTLIKLNRNKKTLLLHMKLRHTW